MRNICACAVIVSVGAASANGAVLHYSITGSLVNNSMVSGGFAGAPAGSLVNLQITVETSTTPGLTSSTQNFWDGVTGTILGLQATVGGYTSIGVPNSAPTHARVVDDALLSGGPGHYDQFWVEASLATPSPDFLWASFTLSSINPTGATASSPLAGTAWPDDDSELAVGSFTNEKQIVIRGPAAQFISATITSATVVPAPGGAGLVVLGMGLGVRRRRPLER